MFKLGQGIVHRNGGLYTIVAVPDERLLEHCAEPFYEYEDIRSGQVWIRRQSEMEDGRFVLAGEILTHRR